MLRSQGLYWIVSIAAAVSALLCVVVRSCVTRAAVMLAAAVAVAVDDRERDAVRAAELAAEERERYAMRAADLECLVAQRMFTSDLQLPQQVQAITYEVAYTMRHNALVDSHDAMTTVRNLLLNNRVARALRVAEDVVGERSAENAESESLDDDESVDMHVEDMQTELLDAVQIPAPAPAAPGQAPFSGRCFRLDDA